MALKAGYKGVKKSILDKLLALSGALIIKSLGTALSLSDAGELRVRNASTSQSGVVRPDGETLVIEGGLLKVVSGSFTREELYTTNSRESTALIDGDLDNYDYIELKLYNPGSNDIMISPSILIPVDRLDEIPYVSDSNVNPHLLLLMWAGIGFSMGFDSATNSLKMWSFNGTLYLQKVYGIKF